MTRFCLILLGKSPKQGLVKLLASKGPREMFKDKAKLKILMEPSELAIIGRSEAAHSMSIGQVKY